MKKSRKRMKRIFKGGSAASDAASAASDAASAASADGGAGSASKPNKSKKLITLAKTLKKLTTEGGFAEVSHTPESLAQVEKLSKKIMDAAASADDPTIKSDVTSLSTKLSGAPLVSDQDVKTIIGLLLKSKAQSKAIIDKLGATQVNTHTFRGLLVKHISVQTIRMNKTVLRNYQEFEKYTEKNLKMTPLDLMKLLSLLDKRLGPIKIKGYDKIGTVGDDLKMFGYLTLDDDTVTMLIGGPKNTDNMKPGTFTTTDKTPLVATMYGILKDLYGDDNKKALNAWLDDIQYSTFFDTFFKEGEFNTYKTEFDRLLSSDTNNGPLERLKAESDQALASMPEQRTLSQKVSGSKKPATGEGETKHAEDDEGGGAGEGATPATKPTFASRMAGAFGRSPRSPITPGPTSLAGTP